MITTGPLILGFDTSTAACRVALCRGTEILDHRIEEMAKGQAERLMNLCKEIIDNAGFHPRDLSAIGVGTGPGNFTGIRISVSAARGLALGLNIPSVGVSAFDALYFGQQQACACAVDARRNSIYLQHFGGDTSKSEPVLTNEQALSALHGPLIGYGGIEPSFPTAVAICHVAGERYHNAPSRPTPMYIRPADAAPARDAPPVILA